MKSGLLTSSDITVHISIQPGNSNVVTTCGRTVRYTSHDSHMTITWLVYTCKTERDAFFRYPEQRTSSKLGSDFSTNSSYINKHYSHCHISIHTERVAGSPIVPDDIGPIHTKLSQT